VGGEGIRELTRDETRVLDATRACIDERGLAAVTIDDIVGRSGLSRATIYRLFPGGREVLFEAMRVRELEVFFAKLRGEAEQATDLGDLLARCVVVASRELADDDQLAMLLAAERGEVLGQLTVDGVPRIVLMATHVLTPLAEKYVSHAVAAQIVEVLARLVISYFLAPSVQVDFTDYASVRQFLGSLNMLTRPPVHVND
jgi:AcrR family transcriptional regulator